MEYSVNQLSALAGVSARTLRYYDKIGLLRPSRVSDSNYRYYGAREVDLLQQILFYRERGIPLQQIADILYREDFVPLMALEQHLKKLEKEKSRLELLIGTVRKTISSMKGEAMMSDLEKFEAFKKKEIEKNEELYGKEVREQYGDKKVEASNVKLLHMTQEEFNHFQKLGEEITKSLRQAVLSGEKPKGDEGKRIAALHKEWLCCTWSQYSTEAHKGLVDMYLQDERFRVYYDSEVEGCAGFLAQAVHAM